MSNQNPNVNPETGIRYGVTANIPDWIFEESRDWDCPAEKEACAEYAREQLTELAEKGELEDSDFPESAGVVSDDDPNRIAIQVQAVADLTDSEAVDMLDAADCSLLQAFWDGADFSECQRIGSLDGCDVMLSSLGGAPLLWIMAGPWRDWVRLCSPCVPNAGDLDSPDGANGYECYAPDPKWYTDFEGCE